MGDRVFGQKMNYIRKQKHMTSEQLSELCDVNAAHIRQIESGLRFPSFKLLADICKYLEASPEYLLEHKLGNIDSYNQDMEKIISKLRQFTPDELITIDLLLDAYLEKQSL